MMHQSTTLIAITLCLSACSCGPSAPSAEQRSAAEASDGFVLGGQIVDSRGRPIAGAEVAATHRGMDDPSFGFVDVVHTDADGKFLIRREVALSGRSFQNLADDIIRLDFKHPLYLYGRLEDLRVLPREQAAHLRITLRNGRSIKGQALDSSQHPLAGALVEVRFALSYDYRKALISDAAGRFEFKGLPAEPATINALTVESGSALLSGHQNVGVGEAEAIVATTPITLTPTDVVHELFGMKLVDVTPALQAAFHLYQPDGLMILDPGPHSEQLEIGQLQRGDCFFVTNDKHLTNFAMFVEELKAASQATAESKQCQLAYSFRRPDFAGTSTQHLVLTPARVIELSNLK